MVSGYRSASRSASRWYHVPSRPWAAPVPGRSAITSSLASPSRPASGLAGRWLPPGQQRLHRRGRRTAGGQRGRSRIQVERRHSGASRRGQDVAGHQGGDGLSRAPGAAEDGDPARTGQRQPGPVAIQRLRVPLARSLAAGDHLYLAPPAHLTATARTAERPLDGRQPPLPLDADELGRHRRGRSRDRRRHDRGRSRDRGRGLQRSRDRRTGSAAEARRARQAEARRAPQAREPTSGMRACAPLALGPLAPARVSQKRVPPTLVRVSLMLVRASLMLVRVSLMLARVSLTLARVSLTLARATPMWWTRPTRVRATPAPRAQTRLRARQPRARQPRGRVRQRPRIQQQPLPVRRAALARVPVPAVQTLLARARWPARQGEERHGRGSCHGREGSRGGPIGIGWRRIGIGWRRSGRGRRGAGAGAGGAGVAGGAGSAEADRSSAGAAAGRD